MKWYEVVVDIGEDAPTILRFKKEEDAKNYLIYSTEVLFHYYTSEVDTDSKNFWYELA